MAYRTEHTWYECPPHCEKHFCLFCKGGLGLCTVCNGFEGELPTECPGREMTKTEKDAIYTQGHDFRDGEWHTSGGPMDRRTT